MKKACLVIVCALIALPLFAGPTATLGEIRGKVEIKPLGKAWVEAKDGMTVDLLATISTGFNSSATLTIAENKIAVAPLTRLTVDKIVEQAGTLGTNLHLRVGKVNAEVKSSSATPQDFKVTSPYSTASVRGTTFEYDGFVLKVEEGTVMFIPGPPPREIVMPQQRRPAAPVAGEGEVSDEEEGTGGEDGTDEVVSPLDFGLADFMAALQEEFPDAVFSIVDDSGQTVEPPAPPVDVSVPGAPATPPLPPPPPPPAAIPVSTGSTLVSVQDFTPVAPGTPPSPPPAPGVPPVVGDTGDSTPPPVVEKVVPTTGRIRIIFP
jgi:hypothetical protein